MNEITVGIMGITALILLILMGTPIGFALILVGLTGFSVLVSPGAALSLLAKEVFHTLSSYSLAVLPLFFLMGQVAFQIGMSKRLFATAYTWLGHLPCGLAMASVGGCGERYQRCARPGPGIADCYLRPAGRLGHLNGQAAGRREGYEQHHPRPRRSVGPGG